jgi:DNA-binding response OmpR family regulator
MGHARVLVVDDEPDAARTTAELLRRAGFQVDTALGGRESLRRIAEAAPDLLLVDFDMPEMDALDVLDELRRGSAEARFPVLILTGARVSPGEQVLGLERGAADYIIKGVNPQVLVARVRSALRDRRPGAAVLRKGRLRIDPAASRAWLGERRLQLERKPFEVLHQLALREGEAVTRAELLRQVWDSDFKGFYHSVDQAVYSIRKELDEQGWIETVYRRGYRFTTVD